MRPIHLSIAGLQSYREVQEIDFTTVTGAGVFGIFGPTGSGKSSILDAMTLALFGKVERAPGGTQAIMNHAETTLSVSFTFELGQPGGRKRYRVDRQFKRGGDVSVNGTVSRLIAYEENGTVVLADKAGEVNQQVADILGLSMQDFTRAVVLPQGKFAEFLGLKGSERRAMLQRLFHLEPYGDRLSAKTAGRFKETDIAVKEPQAERRGPRRRLRGGARRRAGAARHAQAAAAAARAQFAACERRAAEPRAVRERGELAALGTRQAALAARAPAAAALAARLARAAQAERSRPLVRRREAASAPLAQERAAAAARAAALAAAAEALGAAQAAHGVAAGALAAQEAPLAARLEQPRQAAALAPSSPASARGWPRWRPRRARGAPGAGRRRAGARARVAREGALRRQAQPQAELKRAEVGSAERQRLAAALQQKREQDRLRQEAEAQSAELAKQRQELARLDGERQALAQQQSGAEARLAVWVEQLLGLQAQARQAEAWIEERLAALPDEIKKQREAMKQAELSSLASVLAAHLHEGEACPVCGSLEHPQPAGSPADAESGSIEKLERLLAEAREQQLTCKQQLHSLTAMGEQVREALQSEASGAPGLPGLAEAAAAAAPPAAAFSGSLQPGSVLPQLAGAVKQLQAGLSQLLQERRQHERQSQELAARRQSAVQWLEQQERRTQELQSQLGQLESQWAVHFPELSPDSTEQAAAELQAKDELAEQLREKLAVAADFLTQKQSNMETLQQRLNEYEKQHVQTIAERDTLQQQVKQKEDKLALWVASDTEIGKLTRSAEQQLQQLQSEAKRSAEVLDAAGQEQQRQAQADAAARQAVDSAAQAYAEAEREWAAESVKEGFATPEEVTDALLTPQQLEEYTREVEEQRKQEHQVAARLQELQAELAGREVSDEAWGQLEQELAGCKERDEAALEAKAKTERDAEELQAKHERWSGLEAVRQEKQAELQLLGKLQSVLRGNAFVEYLAEEQLMQVSRAASERLGQLTRQKYAIEVDSGGGFVIRDDANGGVRRPVSTLSGGETFLTSLSLALALSAQIQLKGQYPLEFFFLDEGFGTLDQELLETVIGALEKLHMDKLTVGVISHVPELRARLARRLVVHPAEPGGKGSRITLETM
ncbi:SMC family ATPase [Paenibacillus sp. GD4]|uniref:AAA family ATPase n=1 Tax=Paenibacillus sp. GD4 TaxID=3068890 RepID=UPI002796542D|nr:SMC family ATPase [Paenibacillus sp. GD4]MDQ1912923.1 SMC family ATPase [Paenibacillus sp. GD4]